MVGSPVPLPAFYNAAVGFSPNKGKVILTVETNREGARHYEISEDNAKRLKDQLERILG